MEMNNLDASISSLADFISSHRRFESALAAASANWPVENLIDSIFSWSREYDGRFVLWKARVERYSYARRASYLHFFT